MPFQSNELSSIYQEICDRRAYLGRFTNVEYDEEEYSQLRYWGNQTIKYYNQFGEKTKKEARALFLAFACEYIRRNKLTEDTVFWDGFSSEITNFDGAAYNLALGLLWNSYEENDVRQLWGSQNRLIVKSLVSEVQASEVDTETCIDFFCWYYHHVSPGEITDLVLKQYEDSSKRVLQIHPKALPRFHRDCQLLSRIVEYVTESSPTFVSAELHTYRQQIIDVLGEEYDFTRILFVHNAARLKKILTRLENYVIPTKFFKILEHVSSSYSSVRPPYGKALPVYVALKRWSTKTLSYGLYTLDQTEYRVVPQPWISLKAIADWSDEQLITLRGGFLGYKKSTRFDVRGGEQLLESRECFLETGKVCHIWTGKVSKGEPVWIDGQLCSASEGVSWSISFTLIFRDGIPTPSLRCDTLKAFFPSNPKTPITITTSQQHTWEGYLSLDGQLRKSRSIVFPLEPGWHSLSLDLSLGNQVFSQKQVQAQSAYLFSAQTSECIPVGSSREGSGREYYLFAQVQDQLMYDEQILEAELLDSIWGNYAIYRIIWESNAPFRLQVGSCAWDFFKRSYFFTQIATNTQKEHFRFAQRQIQQFSEASLRVFTNIDIAAGPIYCQVLFMEQLIFQVDLCSYLAANDNEPHSYRVQSQFFDHLDQSTRKRLGDERYGHYEFLFYRDERLVNTASLVLLPSIILSTTSNQLILEKEALPVVVNTSPSLLLWNTEQNCLHTSRTVAIHPCIKRAATLLGEQYKGIFGVSSEEIIAPILFPSIGEYIELTVRPIVFGIRLYQRQQVGHELTDYKLVETSNYYALKNTALYIFTRTHARVQLYRGDICIEQGEADSNGNLLLTELGSIQQQCRDEFTLIRVLCEGKSAFFTVHWLPIIYALQVEGRRIAVDLDGPLNTSVVLELVDINRTVLTSFQLPCRGKRYTVAVDLPSLSGKTAQGYIIPYYITTDNTRILGTQQWRVPLRSATFYLPKEWLQAGIGVADDELLALLALDT
jgi:hypothetical protein